ncbi:MAG: hypothetical protein Q8R88_02605 [Desulfoprunum sp.]|nr:hypothetical protein [Desulfoprunum sp.]
MLRKYSNHPPEEGHLPGSKRQKYRVFIVTTSIVIVLVVTGVTLFTTCEPLRQVYHRIATEIHTGLEKDSTGKSANSSFFQLFNRIWPVTKTSPTSPEIPEQQNTSEDFLYTIELANGGKIEGKAIEIEENIITVTDEKGVQIRVSKNGVSRITKIRL